MATPSESQLLWVNQDIKSYKKSKRVSAAQASVINAHSQQQARATRMIASQRALLEGSAVKAIVGWKQQVVSQASSSSTSGDRRPDHEDPQSTKDGDFKSKPKTFELVVRSTSNPPSQKLVPYICGKDGPMDPFNCTAAKIDRNMHDLIEFYLARLHPASLSPKPQDTAPDIESIEAVTMCMVDKACFFSLIACIAAYRESLEMEDQNGRGAIYECEALAALQEQIRRKNSIEKDSLYALINMAICAELLGDYAASLAHLRAAKFVADQEGGLMALDIRIIKLITRADIGLAIKTLSCQSLLVRGSRPRLRYQTSSTLSWSSKPAVHSSR